MKKIVNIFRGDSAEKQSFNIDNNNTFAAEGIATKYNNVSNTELYKKNGLLQKAIALPCGDATRNWIEIEGDTSEEVVKYLETLNFKQHLTRALKLCRLDGSALMLLNFEGDDDFENEVNMNFVRGVKVEAVFPRSDFEIQKLAGSKFDYNHYTLTHQTNTNIHFRVHKSRAILLTNNPLLDDVDNILNDSSSASLILALQELEEVRALILQIIKISKYDIIKVDPKYVQPTKDKTMEEMLKEKLLNINSRKSVHSTILITNTEEVQRIDSSVASFDKLLAKYEEHFASVSNIPTKLLYGSQKSGIGGGVDSDLEPYYNFVSSIQENILKAPIMQILSIVKNILNVDNISFKFKPLWQESEKEITERKLLQAQIDKIYMEAGGIDTISDVLKSRFGGNTYSHNTVLSEFEEDE